MAFPLFKLPPDATQSQVICGNDIGMLEHFKYQQGYGNVSAIPW